MRVWKSVGFFLLISLIQVQCQSPLKIEHRGLSEEGIEIGISPRFIRQSKVPQKKLSVKDLIPSLSLQDLILVLMAKHGDSRTAAAFQSLDDQPLGAVMRILLGMSVDKELAADIVAMQNYAQTADKELVAVIARIVTSDNTVAKDLFTWDEKLRKFPWWLRIRQRIFLNMDKYITKYDPSATPTTTTAPTAKVQS